MRKQRYGTKAKFRVIRIPCKQKPHKCRKECNECHFSSNKKLQIDFSMYIPKYVVERFTQEISCNIACCKIAGLLVRNICTPIIYIPCEKGAQDSV